MQDPDVLNESFRIASELVNYTSQHIFLTGKAGTGKTTFLRHIKNTTSKNVAVVAPTGVAAINANGVTMHSFFQLPFEPFIPVKNLFSNNSHVADKHNLFSKVQLSSIKREVIEELQLLIIDEVSMLRCDKLDAIDTILRGVRKSAVPFGGVQIVFIGDMYQLPPVAPDEEWKILKEYYASPFFFDAHVIKEINLVNIELKKIYRQKEQRFIDVLNNVRNNNLSEMDYELLHSRYIPDFEPAWDEHFITITTHNYKADKINNDAINKLDSDGIIYKGEIEGDFSEKALPAEMNLLLKPGAQVMFIKNDTGEKKAYFNGKLAEIISVTKDEIIVSMRDDGSRFELKKETWENIRYTFNRQKNVIEEEQLGKYTQYPLRLAWAITIHKSQGLTFQQIIIDAGQAFAAGQVYVALSRCSTLDGMVLLSRIYPERVATDERIIAFSNKENELSALEILLEKEKKQYINSTLINSFNYIFVIKALEEYAEFIPNKKLPDIKGAVLLSNHLLIKSKQHYVIVEKFRVQLQNLINDDADTTIITERVKRAIEWLIENIAVDLLQPLAFHLTSIQHAAKVRKYTKHVNDLFDIIVNYLRKLNECRFGDIQFIADKEHYLKFIPTIKKIRLPDTGEEPLKGETYLSSLFLFQEGLSVAEIAEKRGLSTGTIESHLAKFIDSGEVNIYDVYPEEKINMILKLFDDPTVKSIADTREKLGLEFSNNQIKVIFNYWRKRNVEDAGY